MLTSVSLREDDPLLKDLSEKKQSFRRNVVSLATELKEARIRLVEQERSSSKEAMSRQEAETRVQKMEDEIHQLTKELNKKVEQIGASDIATEKCVKELGDIKLQLAATQASALSAESAQSQCRVFSSQLHERTRSLKEHGNQVTRLGERLEDLRKKKLQVRESSQKQLRDEVLKVEGDIMRAVSVVRTKEDFEMQRVLDEDTPNNFGRINKLLMAKDDEIARLRDELKIISAHWRFKTKELEDQVENQRRNDQELKKKVLKLEFCLRETRFQTRKLQKIGERDDVAIQELKEKLAAKRQHEANLSSNQNLWDKSGFKIVVSMSMLILVAFSRR